MAKDYISMQKELKEMESGMKAAESNGLMMKKIMIDAASIIIYFILFIFWFITFKVKKSY